VAVYPYDEYKFTHPRGMFHFRNTQVLGLLPLGIALVLIAIRGLRSGPGLWCALGSALALQMLLWAAHAIQDEPQGRTRWGERFVARTSALLPPLFVVFRGAFVGITLCLLWYSFCELGFPASLFQHTLFVVFLLVPPLRRLLHVDEAVAQRPRVIVFDQFLLHLQVVLVTLLITLSLQYLVFPKDHPYITEVPLPAVILWVPALLICSGSVVMFLDFLRKSKTRPKASIPAAPAKWP
jgi:hypothetical protein